MSFFPRAYIDSEPVTSFAPLFRLLDDFDAYSRDSGVPNRGTKHLKHSFNPKFDVKEVADGYELHGELPGVEQKDVEIEFTDAQTINIRGRSERSYTSGTPPAGLVEAPKTARAIESHQPTVEDENAPSQTEVATTEAEPKEPEHKYWVSERSVGEFARSFTFPSRIDQDAVQASMKNGVLSILVPKAKKPESRKITIS